MTVTRETLFVGVDIGGTKVAAGLVDRRGEIKSHLRRLMVATDGPAEGLHAVTAAIEEVLASGREARAKVAGIGICSPGPLDPKTGIVINPPNLPCWRNFPLAAEVGKVYGVPVRLENDANAAALAEAHWGASRNYRHSFYTSFGTGIGTGIVLNGHIWGGRTGAAGEGGHMSIDYRGPRCNCGKPGCIEILAAGPAIARRARAKLAEAGAAGRLPDSKLLDLAGGNAEAITSEMVGEAYRAGDRLAKEVLVETLDLLSLWLSNIVDFLEPDVIVIGGGVASMLKPFFGTLADGIEKYAVNTRSREIPIVEAHYGEGAGIAGGAALCMESAPPGVTT